MEKQNGITLVALVISIIVLLILATVSISLVINDGILDKAKTAVDKYSEGEIEEKIKLAYLELQTEKLYNSNVDEEEFLTKSLKQTFGDDNVKGVSVTSIKVIVEIRARGYFVKYLYDVETGIAKIIEGWIQDEDGSYSNGSIRGVQVGDIVHYETELSKTENAVDSKKKVQLVSELGIYSGNTDLNYNTDSSITRDSLTWKVLDVKDGKIRLISTVPTTSQVSLYGANGYNNAVYLLDKTCDTLYSSNVGKAQNLKIEDIEEKINKTQFDYTEWINSSRIKYGEIKKDTYNLRYPKLYPSEIGCISVSETDINKTGNELDLSSQINPIDGISDIVTSLELTMTYWSKTMNSDDFTNSKYYMLFLNNGTNYPPYWLSSRTVQLLSNDLAFRVRWIHDSLVGSVDTWAYYSYNNSTSGNICALRPVVTLSSEIQLSGNSTNGWMIN